MDDQLMVRVRLEVQFDDGTTIEHSLGLDPFEAPTDLPGDALVVSVAGELGDSGVAERIERAIRLAVDRWLGDASPPANLDAAVLEAARAIVPLVGGGTAVQARKIERFRSHPLSGAAVDLARLYRRVIEPVLPTDSIGVAWGVTLSSNRSTLVRFNVGSFETMYVLTNADGSLYVHGSAESLPPGLKIETRTGFDRVRPFCIVRAPLAEFAGLLEDPIVASAACAQADACHAARSTLGKSNWHNPLAAELLWP